MKLIKRAGVRTEEEKRARVRQVMALHRAGYSPKVIGQRTGTEPGKARKWAAELGIPWEGKAGRVLKEKSDPAQRVPTHGKEGG